MQLDLCQRRIYPEAYFSKELHQSLLLCTVTSREDDEVSFERLARKLLLFSACRLRVELATSKIQIKIITT
jgi:hypothetical protein